MAYTTASYISSVERQAFLPTGQATFTSSDILSMGNEAIRRYLLPSILRAREEYFITYKDYTIVANQSVYAIPYRGIGAAVRQIQLIDSNSNVREIDHISLDRVSEFSSTTGTPSAYYLRGDKIVLISTPSSAIGTLRVFYALRPGDLITTDAGAVISAINTATNVITVTTIPSTWVTGNGFDLLSKQGSHLYLDAGIDLTSTLISGSDITLPSLPSDLVVGDYIALAGYSPLIQLPADCQPILATFVAAEMLIAMNQPSGSSLLTKAKNDLSEIQVILTPRVSGAPELIIPDWS